MAQTRASSILDFLSIYLQAYPDAVVHLNNPGNCVVETNGAFNLDSFNPRGCLKLSAILQAIDVNGGMSFWRQTGPQYLELGKLGYMTFSISAKVTCEPELYDPNIAKQPIKVENQLVHVGRTSYHTRIKIFLPKVEKPVAVKDFVGVFVDPETRRPVAPPSWWRDKHIPFCLQDEGHKNVGPQFDFKAFAGSLQEDEIRVQTIDVDSNSHCNHVSFPRFCYEAYERSQFHQIKGTSQRGQFRNVKRLACSYKGEAGLGDLLTVSFVQNPVDKDTYHFQIRNDKKNVICECHLTFFPQIVSKY